MGRVLDRGRSSRSEEEMEFAFLHFCNSWVLERGKMVARIAASTLIKTTSLRAPAQPSPLETRTNALLDWKGIDKGRRDPFRYATYLYSCR